MKLNKILLTLASLLIILESCLLFMANQQQLGKVVSIFAFFLNFVTVYWNWVDLKRKVS